jgi:hypothetical protein
LYVKEKTIISDNLIKLLRAYTDLPVHKIPSIHHGQKYEAKARRCYAKELSLTETLHPQALRCSLA